MKGLQRTTDGVIFQAVLTGSLSFSHIHDLAAAHGQAGWKAWLYPLSVDLLTVAAYRKLIAAHRVETPTGLAWCAFLLGLGASLAANIAAVWQNPDRLVAVALGVWPAVAFLVCTLLSHEPEPVEKSEVHERLPVQVEAALPVPENAPTPALPKVEKPALPAAAKRVDPPAPEPPQAPTRTAPDGWEGLLSAAREVDEAARKTTGRAAGVGRLKVELGIGQTRAQQLRDALAAVPAPA